MNTKTEKFARDEFKKRGHKRLLNSFKYAYQGVKYAFRHEQNMTVQVIISSIVIVVGLIVGLSRIEWILLFLLMGLVIGSELINTSIEAMLDVIKPEINPVVKVAKDTSAAAVLLFCIMTVIIGILIFAPHIVDFVQRYV